MYLYRGGHIDGCRGRELEGKFITGIIGYYVAVTPTVTNSPALALRALYSGDVLKSQSLRLSEIR